MAVERQNPLPSNRYYWVDVGPEDAVKFGTWLNHYKEQVVVRGRQGGANGWEWVLFEVTAPLVWWDGPGFPSIGREGLREHEVKQVPSAPSSGDVATQIAETLVKEIAPWVVAVAVGAAIVRRIFR
jgi:hypothetical protein